jgi:(1->4)-alpha-D-glucan 1-alpha-D-glucosylmutase
MLGAWPLEPEEEPDFIRRLKDYILKAVREAKEYTSWIAMNRDYEDLVLSFIDAVTAPAPENVFPDDFRVLLAEIEFCGALNSLAQILLKTTCPGVPDFYRGQELWDFSLVDPDNRRPVDFRRREELLKSLVEEPAGVAELMSSWRDGRIKLHVTGQCLATRRRFRRLFEKGDYLPMEVSGPHSDNICAFARRDGDEWAVVAVPRFFRKLGVLHDVGGETWGEDLLRLPDNAPEHWYSAVDEAVRITVEDGGISLAPVFHNLPLALLIPEGQGS